MKIGGTIPSSGILDLVRKLVRDKPLFHVELELLRNAAAADEVSLFDGSARSQNKTMSTIDKELKLKLEEKESRFLPLKQIRARIQFKRTKKMSMMQKTLKNKRKEK